MSTNTLLIPNMFNTAFPNSKTVVKVTNRPSNIKTDNNEPNLNRSSQSSPQNIRDKTSIHDMSRNRSTSYNPIYPDSSTKEDVNTSSKEESSRTDDVPRHIMRRDTGSDSFKITSGQHIIILNQDPTHDLTKNDYINISGSETEEISQVTPISSNREPHISMRGKNELMVISEESMSMPASRSFSKPNIADQDSSDHRDTVNKDNKNSLLLVPKEKKIRNLSRFKTSSNQDFEMMDLVTDLQNLSQSKNKKPNDNDSIKFSNENLEVDSRESKMKHSLRSTIKKNLSKVGNKTQNIDPSNKASYSSKNNSHEKSLSSISQHCSINIDEDEKRPVKRTQTNMIPVNMLSDYKFPNNVRI